MSDDIYAEIPTGAYVKWDEPGQRIVGDVLEVRVGKSLQGDKVPEYSIRLDSGDEVIVTASQGQLKALCLKERPVAGDRVRITYTGDQRRDGGKTLKLFTLDVTKGGARAPVMVNDDEF